MLKKALNPIWYLNGLTAILHDLFGRMLRWLGLMKSQPPIAHDNTQVDDVLAAAEQAAEDAAAMEELGKQMTPAEVVRKYAKANEEDRPSIDLSALTAQQQDWLLSRSDVDLVFLANETDTGLERSLEALQVFRWKPRRPEQEPAPVLSTTPMSDEEKALFIRARVSELWLPNGSANPEPKYRG
ncbi:MULTISPECIES: hypothetical protein [unclassified Rhizobium]|uniref:hypothetical protein n=1 Tax=unclassified Rhizobium TaxID=2613769 RepID=UPI00161AE59C|nr:MULTISPECIES: hypothetical protein [unclassified Rhizobium]MBB3521019.1 hypothetical protein [Rhizobium sp. BK456]MDR6664049.1 hypothetical protein [Rhizobium sp. 1399]